MEESKAVTGAVLRFYDRISAKDVGAFDELVSSEPANSSSEPPPRRVSHRAS
jgi:hypothetical protein